MSYFPGGHIEFSGGFSIHANGQPSLRPRRTITPVVPASHRRERAPLVPITFLAQARQDLIALRQNLRGRWFYTTTAGNVVQGLARAIGEAETARHDEDLHLLYKNFDTALGAIDGVDGITAIFKTTLYKLGRPDSGLLAPRPRAPLASAPSAPLPVPGYAPVGGENKRLPNSSQEEKENPLNHENSSPGSQGSGGSLSMPSSASVSSSILTSSPLERVPLDRDLQPLREANQRLQEEKHDLEQQVVSLQGENKELRTLLEQNQQQHEKMMGELKQRHEAHLEELTQRFSRIVDQSLADKNAAITTLQEGIKVRDASIKEKDEYIALLLKEGKWKGSAPGDGGGNGGSNGPGPGGISFFAAV